MLYQIYQTQFKNFGVDTPLRIAHFMAQIDHESNLKPVCENLNYSKERLLIVFPKYFNATNVDQYAKKPEKIANRIYANRMGNGDEKSDDGWKYRGRGLIQLTGRNNYKALSDALKVDYLGNPDLLLNEADAIISALWFWTSKKLNQLADLDDIVKITKRINGGINGLEDRKKKLAGWKTQLNKK